MTPSSREPFRKERPLYLATIRWWLCFWVTLLLNVTGEARDGGLAHRYSFTVDARDSVGGADGVLKGGAKISAGAVVLDGINSYVDLPNNLVTGYTSITLEAWVVDNGSGAWGRIWDLGNSTGGEDFTLGTSTSGTQYMFLTSRSGSGTLRGAYTVTGGGSGEQIVEWPGTALPTGVLKHVVWSSDGSAQSAWLYVDGVLVGSNNAVTLTPAALGPTVNNWLGRSQFNDPLFKGSISEFRIYGLALDPVQIAVDFAAGPDNVVTNPGPLQSLSLQLSSPMMPGSSQMVGLQGTFANVTNVNLSSVPGVGYFLSDTNVAVINTSGRLVAVNAGIASISASYQGLADTQAVQVTEAQQTLAHRYSFTADAHDSEGTAHGTLAGGATITNGAVVLNGSSAYVDLPNDIVNGLNSVTFEAWFTDNGSASWARVWDFGNSVGGEGSQGGGTSYMFLSVPSGLGTVRGAYELPGTGEQIVDTSVRPSIGIEHHLVWIQDGLAQTASIYLDGVLIGANTQFTYTPAGVGSTVNDWLGRSQYNDPYFYGSIDEFRIFNAALSPAEVLQDFQLGPDLSPQSGPVAITTQPQGISVNEQQPATFTVGYIGRRPVQFQWFRNGVPIPGATNGTYQLAAPLPTDNGARFSVALTNRVTNTVFSALSSTAALTVIADTIPPTVSRIANVGTTNVQIVFSEPVEAASATNTSNYAFTNGVAVTGATLGADKVTVTLSVGPLVFGSNYTIVLNGVRDRAFVPNTLAPNTTLTFYAAPYDSLDIGGAAPAGSLSVVDGGFDVTASGSSIGGTADQFNFSYQMVSGDFDWEVRLQGMSAVDLWSKAGLMARETLDAGSRCAAVLATANLQGTFFESRSTPSGPAAVSGSFPPNFPNGWLRLQRIGNQFSGYASYDGVTWTLLGSVSLNLPNTIYVGLAVASHSNGQMATAQFRQVGITASTIVGVVPNSSEPLGPSSRRTPLAISEIMYKPAKRADGKNLEFVEIFNSNPFFHDLSGYQLVGEIQYTFPPKTELPGGGFMVVAAVPGDVQSVYGLPAVAGPYVGTLKANGTLQLLDEVGAVLLEVTYADTPPWPAAADGAGHSLVLARPSYGEADPRAWDISDVVGGSPGTFETYRPSPLRNVVINEILAHTELPDVDRLELYNYGNQGVDLSGCVLTDDPATNKFVIPTNTVISARGYLVFDANQLGYHLSAGGETVYLKNPTLTRVLDAARFGAQEIGVAFGRYPDGASEWYRLSAQTFGGPNAAPLVSQVGINEIMYHPLSGLDDDQFIELYNQGATSVDLGGWSFAAGVNFTFPTNTVVGPGGYLVVAKNAARLMTNYPNLNLTNTLGNFSGRLSGRGERLALAKPQVLINSNGPGAPVTNLISVVVDEVTYGTGGRWGEWSDGGGSSLELIDPRADKRLAANWADSDETGKAPWTTIEATGVLDNGANYDATIDYAQVGLLDAGECLIDDVEVLPTPNGPNYVPNPGFESGLTNWSLQGAFSRSSIETNAGYPAGGNALHLRTGDRIWSGANAALVMLTNTTLAPNSTATLRFRARWLKGWPEAMMRLSGNWLEAAGRLPVPLNLGTPGAPNSRAVPNAGPAIHAVTHAPSLPAANQPVVVTARAADPDGVASLRLNYRVDPSLAYTSLQMVDDGTGGDAVAGDGIYSATIPGQAAGGVVAFTVTATDARGAASRFPALLDNHAPDRECVIVFGDPDPPSSFGAYHLWLTQTNIDRWNALPVLSNEEMDGTLVCGSRVIYNMGARYAGSPYHQGFSSPLGNPCHYTWSVPKDEQFLGSASFNKIHWTGNDIQDDTPSLNVNDGTLQREQAANTFLRGLGIPWVNRRFIAVYVNGHRRGHPDGRRLAAQCQRSR